MADQCVGDMLAELRKKQSLHVDEIAMKLFHLKEVQEANDRLITSIEYPISSANLS